MSRGKSDRWYNWLPRELRFSEDDWSFVYDEEEPDNDVADAWATDRPSQRIKKEESEAIRKDVEDFLLRGGSIQMLDTSDED